MGFFDIFKKKQDNAAADIPESRQQQQEELSAGLEKTKTGIFSKLARAVAGRSTVDADVLDDVEEVLITSDVGVETTVKIIRRIEERVARDKYMNTSELQSILREEVMSLMEESHGSEKHFGLDARQGEPYVVMVVGVNGAGKTTTIGKLTRHLADSGQRVLLAAADTFRAAAREQLMVWADRNRVEIVSQEGGDPAAVTFDAVKAGHARSCDVVIADTAGRLATQLHLMEELRKIKRVIGKAMDSAPHEVLLVVDGNTGQNALSQVKAFDEALGLTGLVVTKLDGTAKGGVLAAIALWSRERHKHVPVYFIGVGEKLEDLQTFKAREFAQALLS